MSEYRLLVGSGTLPWHVVDDQGLPHSELTVFASMSPSHHSARTARLYTRAVLVFFSWAVTNPIALRQGWSFLGPPETVRNLISHFLTTEMKCVIVIKRDKVGFETRRVEPKWDSKRCLSHLLAALRSFYSIMSSVGLYQYPNPMDGDRAVELISEEKRRALERFSQMHGRKPMPQVSGVDNVRFQRMSSAYFRLRGGEWVPSIIDDVEVFNSVLQAGEKWGWSLREISISRVLFESGARISETCALTIGDWQKSGFGTSFDATNKGSFGRRVKQLFVTDRTAKILRQYVDTERRALDREKRGLNELLLIPHQVALSIPLFLTRNGSAVSSDHFRRNYWNPAMEAAGIQIVPHQSRHWFVTSGINECGGEGKPADQVATDRGTLRHLMGWTSDMLPVYDQAIQKTNRAALASRIHARIDKGQELSRTTRKETKKENEKPTAIMQMLHEMLGGRRDSAG